MLLEPIEYYITAGWLVIFRVGSRYSFVARARINLEEYTNLLDRDATPSLHVGLSRGPQPLAPHTTLGSDHFLSIGRSVGRQCTVQLLSLTNV